MQQKKHRDQILDLNPCVFITFLFSCYMFLVYYTSFPNMIFTVSTIILTTLASSIIPPIRPPIITFKANIPTVPDIPYPFGKSFKNMNLIPKGIPAIIQKI